MVRLLNDRGGEIINGDARMLGVSFPSSMSMAIDYWKKNDYVILYYSTNRGGIIPIPFKCWKSTK